MKHKKPSSLRKKVFLYCISFSVTMLLLLWSFQTFFLNDFYKSVKTHKVESFANQLKEVIESEITDDKSLIKFIEKNNKDKDYYIVVYNNKGQLVYQTTDNKMICSDFVSNPEKTNKLLKETKNKKGGVLNIDHCDIKDEDVSDKVDRNMEYITYSDIYKAKNDDYFVIINSRANVVHEVGKTVTQQLGIVSVIMVFISLLIAWLFYRSISKPIEELTDNAKELAKGNFDLTFHQAKIREIETLNETLAYASSELSHIDNLKNELIANVSHDFKTPLTMISGYAQMMLDLPDEKNEENIKVIIEECNRLTMLVNDLLDLSKIQSNNSELNIQPINLSSLCESVCSRFNAMIADDGYHIDFEKNQDVIVLADEIKINQVLYNIIGNAVHYTGKDKRVVVRQTVNNDKVLIEIIDSGKGIKPEELPYIWDRYYKNTKVTKRQSMGTGIGLSIVKGVLEQHKVKYGVNSEIGKGSTFYFEFPIDQIL